MNQYVIASATLYTDIPITIDDFLYFTEESEEKIKKMGLPNPQCKLNNFFYSSDANDMKYHQREYCLLNCGLKCLATK